MGKLVALSERFAWQGRRIAWGSAGSGPAVVFCHGTPWSSWLWRPFAEALAGDLSVYLWDMPGYGRSSKDEEHPVDFGVQANALAALLAHWGISRPHVLAHDYGGAVALRTHLVHEVPFASLLMADVVAVPPVGSPFFRLVEQHSDVLQQLPPYIHEAVVRAYIGDASQRGLRDDELAELAAPWLGRGPAGVLSPDRRIRRALPRRERDPAGSDVHPGQDPVGERWIPFTAGERIAAAIAGATLTRVEHAAHLIQLDAPVALATELRSWLTGRTAR